MAKLEIPSIIVQSGSHTHPVMEAPQPQWLSPQEKSDLGLSLSPNELEDPPMPIPAPAHNNILPRSRSKANLKLLKRSHAIKESTSPPPDISPLPPVNAPAQPDNNNTVMVNNNGRVLRRDSSSESNWSATTSLSRGNSIEQSTDPSGIDIEQFLIETLHKNTKDRMFLLKIENDLISFANDTRKTSLKFGAMSSYQRMLVHRVAHYFGMEHNVDASGHMVIVNKSRTTRVPETRFSDLLRIRTEPENEDKSGKGRKICFGPEKVKKHSENGHKSNERDDLLSSEEPRRSILKRDSASFEDNVSFKSPDRHLVDTPRRSKSFEEREEEYEKARRRIFHQEQDDSQEEEDLRWPQPSTDSTKLHPNSSDVIDLRWQQPSTDSTKLHPNSNRSSRLAKVESYESKDTLKANSLRSSISKSYSFGGYDQNPPNQRVLTKQDSGSSMSSSGVSPLSSGYKSRSEATISATPSPTATPHLATQLSNQSGALSPEPEPTVMWAVTNMASVPAGSVLINPQTGRPFTNEDGSIYHFDPANPPNLERQSSISGQHYQNVGGNEEGRGEGVQEGGEPVTASASAPVPQSAQPILAHSLNDNHTYQAGDAAPSMPMAHNVPPPTPSQPLMQFPAHLVLPPPNEPPPTMYATPPMPPVGYDRMPIIDGGNQEVCSYMMNLNLSDGRGDAAHRPVFYCPSAPAHPPTHYPQGPGATMQMYLSSAAPPRYPYTYTTTPYPSTDRNPVQECAYPTPPVHAYTHYSRCPSNTQVNETSSYCPANGSNGMMGLLTLPPAPAPAPSRPYHRPPLPTPPPPQTGYPVQYNSGYAAMPGCYPHYQPANPPILRPALQLNVCSSPRSDLDSTSHTASPIRFPTPASLYRFTYPTNDLILLNTSRSQFSSPAANVRCPGALPIRRQRRSPTPIVSPVMARPPRVSRPPRPEHLQQGILMSDSRPRPIGGSGGQSVSRPVLGMGTAASQQQAALATAIEAAGLVIPPGGYHMMGHP